jgi:4-amino-4-deoxy-L-arabinose transferase-like glycosyltransferase
MAADTNILNIGDSARALSKRLLAHLGGAQSIRMTLRRHGAPLGLALLVGAVLRLVWPTDTSFLGDQAELLALGRSAAAHHAFIVTGILSSIGSLNPPISTWLYGPFSLLGGANGPLSATIFTALVNVLAVGLLYAVTTRYGSRRAGFVAALLYATASGPIYYSRFIWQQNLLPPFLMLFLWAVLDGVIARKRGWLGWATLWWSVAFQLHPTSAALLAVLALAIALTWRSLRWRDVGLAVGAAALVFLPTLVWEVASHGADIAYYRALIGGQSSFDTTFFKYYAQLLAPSAFGVASGAYSLLATPFRLLGWLMVGLALAAGAWLVYCVCGEGLQRVRRDGMRGFQDTLQEIVAAPRWRLAAILLLWQLVFVALFVHHARKFPIHYLLVLLPIIYISIGLWADAAARWLENWLAMTESRATRWRRPMSVALPVLTIALVTAQTIGVVAQLGTIHSGSYDGATIGPLGTRYGIPLASQQQTLATAETAATRARAPLVIASTTLQQESYGYLAQTSAGVETPAVYVSDGCVLAPAVDSSRPLVTLALPGTLAYSALPVMTGVHALGTLSATGSQRLALYELAPTAGVQGATRLASHAAGATGPELDAYGVAYDARGQAYLMLRWSNGKRSDAPSGPRAIYWYGAAASGPIVTNYTIQAQRLDADGKPTGALLEVSCSRVAWDSDLDMLAWIPIATSMAKTPATWSVRIYASQLAAARPQIGPLTMETGDVTFGPRYALAGPTKIIA